MTTLRFPDGFLWGTATAAHQVEGGNWNCDWWAWEHDPDSPCVEPSGDACDHYHRWPDDLSLLAGLGFGAYRFSIEWARIEPEEGEISSAQLEHYRRVLAGCHERGLLPVVTFHHFTSPRWVAASGGWEEPRTAERFARFCESAVERLGDLIGMACTINEPNSVATWGHLVGLFPPGPRGPEARLRANDTFVAAHHRAVEVLKSGPGDYPVGITVAMNDWQAVEGGEAHLDELRRPMEDVFLEAARTDDYIGVQAYTRARVGPDGVLGPEEGVGTTQMGYEYWPGALEATVRRAWEVTGGVPVHVTENGIGTADDQQRVEYVTRALEGLHRCITDGLDVRSYFYWSALDNFEWALGYAPTFGLVAVDRRTQERRPKPSAGWLGSVAKANALEP